MHLKKISAVLATIAVTAVAGVGIAGTAQASTAGTASAAVTASRQAPATSSYIQGFYSSKVTCSAMGDAYLAGSLFGNGVRGFFCQDGWGAPTPWALILYID
jgi:hypothetical protein